MQPKQQTEMADRADRGLFPSHINVQSDAYTKSTANLTLWPPFLPYGNPLVELWLSVVTEPLDVRGRKAVMQAMGLTEQEARVRGPDH
jgi:hypothetical protein